MSALRFWEGLPKTGHFPHKKALDPALLPRDVFPNVHLLEVLHDTRDFKFLLVGRENRRMLPQNPVGLTSRSFSPPDLCDFFFEHVDVMHRTHLPVYSESMIRIPDRSLTRNRRLYCPFVLDEPDRIDFVMVVAFAQVEEDTPNLGPIPVNSETLDR